MQPGIENFWKIDSKFSMNFTIGLDIIGIQHKDLLRFSNDFKVIGKVIIIDIIKKLGAIGYQNTFGDYCSRF